MTFRRALGLKGVYPLEGVTHPQLLGGPACVSHVPGSSVAHTDTHCHLEQWHFLLQGAAQSCSWEGLQCRPELCPAPAWDFQRSEGFSQAFLEMAASVCVHACSSSVLHEAKSAQLLREHLLQQSGVGKQVAHSPCSNSYSQSFGTSGVVITGVWFLLGKGA